MKHTLTLLAALLLISLDLLHAAESVARPSKPNIIFVLADDLGWSELGCYGNGFNETPHLDQLAKDGMRFTQAYAAAPVCSPYRAALLTGQYPARVGILDYLRPDADNALSIDHVTLPEMLQRNGYRNGMIGKWHLTGYEHHGAKHEIKPRDHGFDGDFAREVKGVGNGANFWPYVFSGQNIRWIDIPENRLGENEFLVDRMNLEAVDFIERNKDRPFFLYLSHYAPHSILNGKPELVEEYRQKHSPGNSTREKCYLCKDQGHTGDALRGFGCGFEFGELGSRLVFVVLNGPEGVDDSFVASLKLGIVVQRFADRVALFDGGLYALEGFWVAGFELGLSTGRFCDQGSELLVTGGFESSMDLTEFRRKPVSVDSSLFQMRKFRLLGENVIVFRAARFVDPSFHDLEVGVGLVCLLSSDLLATDGHES